MRFEAGVGREGGSIEVRWIFGGKRHCGGSVGGTGGMLRANARR